MLTLHVFGPYFDLPDPSPFCLKALVLMKASALQHKVEEMSFSKAPKGKAPYLNDNGLVIADSHFLMRHLETTYKIDFSGGYSSEQLAKGWAVARMLEEHFYFLAMHIRWLHDGNFWKGPYQFFKGAPKIIRPLIARIVRRKTRKTVHLQGLGRHTEAERLTLAKGDLDAIETMLGNNPYFLGKTFSAVDASVFGFLWTASISYFESPVGDNIRSRLKLVAYLDRMTTEFFPEFGA
jgi:glutathione S-transferase